MTAMRLSGGNLIAVVVIGAIVFVGIASLVL
jgi:hypothetical protein